MVLTIIYFVINKSYLRLPVCSADVLKLTKIILKKYIS